VAGRGEDVDHRLRGGLDGLGRTLDVGLVRAGQGADDGPLYVARDRVDALEVALAGDRETRLDDVHAHAGEGVGDLELLDGVERHARALLPVPQRRVE